jgi:phospho-N-acetylmuramoyl-pentapeptide-transferase
VVAQVASFRLLGRRVLACAPLHNHFVFRGVHEVKIVIRFWIIAALLAIAGVASLRLG